MSADIDDGTAGGSTTEVITEFTIENLKKAFSVSDYINPNARTLGGTVMLASLVRDFIKGGLSFVGYGLAANIMTVVQFNLLFVDALAAFLQAWYGSLYGDGIQQSWQAAMLTAQTQLQSGGIFAWFIAVLEFLAIIWLGVTVARRLAP
ncbi:hypothetical protein [Halobaculum sp. P14]|uniref:hypothetical protein n=1 Tax=Halobaculum sp. P14 TaxID=3421638 RepID=UPI003EB7F147